MATAPTDAVAGATDSVSARFWNPAMSLTVVEAAPLEARIVSLCEMRHVAVESSSRVGELKGAVRQRPKVFCGVAGIRMGISGVGNRVALMALQSSRLWCWLCGWLRSRCWLCSWLRSRCWGSIAFVRIAKADRNVGNPSTDAVLLTLLPFALWLGLPVRMLHLGVVKAPPCES